MKPARAHVGKAAIVATVAAAMAVLASQPPEAQSARTPAATKPAAALWTISPACHRDVATETACDTVARYFEALNARELATACSLLGSSLRSETGGGACPRVLAYGSERKRVGILGVRRLPHAIGVVVAVPLRELDHMRELHWLALVGPERGQVRILDTRLT